ncbi:hypothetical protein Ancab_000094 [Ancistrocladus abbreviatus]
MGSSGNNSCACKTGGESSNAATTTSITSADEAALRRTLDTFGQRTSIYRGVTRHRWTERHEAYLWDNSCRREGRSRKGRQVYILFSLDYALTLRKSSGFSRGASMYRGVTRHHQHGRWQARIGRVAGNKDLYLGTFTIARVDCVNYSSEKLRPKCSNQLRHMSRYNVRAILEGNTLPIGGGAAKRLKEAQAIESSRKRDELIALNSGLHHPYGSSSSSSSRLQAYPLLQYEQQQPQPLLSLQNHDISLSHFAPDSQFQQNYIQTQLQLHQLSSSNANNAQLYGHLFQNNPASVHGLTCVISSSSSVMKTDGGSYNGGGYLGNCGVGMGLNSTASNPAGSSSLAVDNHQELAVVKVDYDQMPSGSGGYGGWSADSVQGPNPGLFSMRND